ncbi:MAG: transglutaminase domain-containing protein [Aureispira sp.]|nr:transglutaminase domain-containing protein [Aureispira sp.]
MENKEKYTMPAFYMDSDHSDVIDYTHQAIKGISNKKDQIIQLFYTVRDGFRYNPYHVVLKPYALKASHLLTKDYGYCIEKSNLFAAAARVLGVPSRLGFANVRNHLATSKLEEYLKNDLLVFHGYAEVYLEGKWVKATPVFDTELCKKMGVAPLDFDGEQDSVFQESDKTGNPFMDYVDDHGVFHDVPLVEFENEMRKHYPHLFNHQIRTDKFHFEFEERS